MMQVYGLPRSARVATLIMAPLLLLQLFDSQNAQHVPCKHFRSHGDRLEQVLPAVNRLCLHLRRSHASTALAPPRLKTPPALAQSKLPSAAWCPARRASTCALHLIPPPLQIALSAVTAAVSLVRFVQWKRLDESDRDTIWRLYGVFTFSAFVGSVFGALTWSLYLTRQVLYYDALRLGVKDPIKSSTELSASYKGYPAFHVFKSLAFLFVSVSKLMVFDRMTQFSVKRAQGALVRRLGIVQRVVLGIVLVVNAVAVAAALASTSYYSLASGADASAAAAYSSHKNETGALLLLDAERHLSAAYTCIAVAHTCNVGSLLVIMTAFAGAGVFVAVRIRHFLAGVRQFTSGGVGQSTSAARSARYLLLQACITVAVVFVTFLIRTALETVEALGDFYNVDISSCGLCEPCQSEFFLIRVTIIAVPEVKSIVVALAEPFTLLVALWGMTSERGARLLNRRRDSHVQSMKSLQRTKYLIPQTTGRDSLLDAN